MIIVRFFRLSILMLLILLSWPSLTHAQTIMPYNQFLNLSDEQKKSYIEMIRSLALDLSQNQNLVDVVQTPSRRLFLDQFFVQAIPSSQAASKNDSASLCAKTNFKNSSNDDLFGDMSLTLNCREIQSDRSEPLYYKPGVQDRIEALYAELMARIKSGKITPKSKYYKEGIGGFRAVIAEIQQHGTKNKKVGSAWMSQEYANLGRLGAGGSPYAVEKSPSTQSQKPTSSKSASKAKPESKPNLKDTSTRTKVSSKKTKAEIGKDREKTKNSSKSKYQNLKLAKAEFLEEEFSGQCLYAGFVIPKNSENKCQPFKVLPFESTFLDSKTFVCPKTEQILCNPLLFGYEETNCKSSRPAQARPAQAGQQTCDGKKPICVYRSVDATKNCYEQAKRKKTLNQTMELWKSPEGEKLYKEYVESLEELCDSGRLERRNLSSAIFSDITKTCEVAFSVLKENIKNNFLPEKVLPNESNKGTK